MRQIIGLSFLACMVYLFTEKTSYANYGSYDNYSYNTQTIIKVYKITDEVITESQKIDYYQSIDSNFTVSSNEILDNITFVEN